MAHPIFWKKGLTKDGLVRLSDAALSIIDDFSSVLFSDQ